MEVNLVDKHHYCKVGVIPCGEVILFNGEYYIRTDICNVDAGKVLIVELSRGDAQYIDEHTEVVKAASAKVEIDC